jgi:hypothetical protein
MVLPFWGYFFNEPTKVASLLKKSQVTLLTVAKVVRKLKTRPGFRRENIVKVSQKVPALITNKPEKKDRETL